MAENMLAEVAVPDQRAAKKIKPGHCTKTYPSRVSGVDRSRDWYIALPTLAPPSGNTFGRGLLFTWDKRYSPNAKQTTCSSARVKKTKLHTFTVEYPFLLIHCSRASF